MPLKIKHNYLGNPRNQSENPATPISESVGRQIKTRESNGEAVAEIPLKIRHNYLGNPRNQSENPPNSHFGIRRATSSRPICFVYDSVKSYL